MDDLSTAIKAALNNNEHVIVMLDGNQDMKNSYLSQQLTLLRMREAILHKHGIDGPSTFRRNESRTPRDGIWISDNLEISKGGYLEYDQFLLNADHRYLWLGISFTQAFGHNMPAITKPRHRRGYIARALG